VQLRSHRHQVKVGNHNRWLKRSGWYAKLRFNALTKRLRHPSNRLQAGFAYQTPISIGGFGASTLSLIWARSRTYEWGVSPVAAARSGGVPSDREFVFERSLSDTKA
jgi:hypothetical protein